jgi:hypothetical protein
MAPVMGSHGVSALRVPVRGVRSVIEVTEEYSILRVWVLSRSFFEGDTMVDVKRGRPRNQARSRGSREREPLQVRSVSGMGRFVCVGGLGVGA